MADCDRCGKRRDMAELEAQMQPRTRPVCAVCRRHGWQRHDDEFVCVCCHGLTLKRQPKED